ncbi:Alpha/Beta hydrolase protein [Powellomyces hirtus]|nr:Alpha/Beta hydrolase protein [Powellomyces hirtus]
MMTLQEPPTLGESLAKLPATDREDMLDRLDGLPVPEVGYKQGSAAEAVKTPQPVLIDSAYTSTEDLLDDREIGLYEDEHVAWGGDDEDFPLEGEDIEPSPPSFDHRRVTATLDSILEEDEGVEGQQEGQEEELCGVLDGVAFPLLNGYSDGHRVHFDDSDETIGEVGSTNDSSSSGGPAQADETDTTSSMANLQLMNNTGGIHRRRPQLIKPQMRRSFRTRHFSLSNHTFVVPTESEAITKIPGIPNTGALIEFWGYPCEKHEVQTKDGYVLTLFRIPNPQGGMTAYTAPVPYRRPPVILWHGLCINSAAFCCSPGGVDKNLALYLADEGFDVWLANSRGSFMSRKHAHWPSAEEIMFHSRYWAYVGMDEMAKFDVPAVVDHVLRVTQWSKVGYIGYSQGTTKMFMSLSLSEEMNEKIAVFVGLAPAMKPKPVANAALSGLTTSFSPSALFLALGCWSALPHAEWVRVRVFADMYGRIIHNSIQWLLGWQNDKYPREWWPALYRHLYGGGSVRNIVHWFQIITEQTFTPYDHERAPHSLPPIGAPPNTSTGSSSTHHSAHTSSHIQTYAPKRIGPCPYPTHHITTPMHLFCGENDNISDNPHYNTAFGPNARVTIVPDYEHMDFLWAPNAKDAVWSSVVDALGEAMHDVEDEMLAER